MLRQTLVEPVDEGRLRNLDWPYGLLALVVAGYAMFALAGLTVILSGLIRQQSTLIISVGLQRSACPRCAVWPLVVLLSFGAASFLTAALHGPWWLKILGLLFVLMITGSWSLRSAELSGGPVWLVAAAVIMVALVVFVILRWRRRFAWWEFAVLLGPGRRGDGDRGRRGPGGQAVRFRGHRPAAAADGRACSASWPCRPPSSPVRRSPRSPSGPRWRPPGTPPGWPTAAGRW